MTFSKGVPGIRLRISMARLGADYIQSHGLEPKDPMDWFTRDIDEELRSPYPPPCEIIVTLYLLLNLEFMAPLLKRGFRGHPSIAGISHDPYHPLHAKVQMAFDWAQKRRKLAGFPPDPWPMRFELPRRDRRLVWNPEMREIKEAFRMYHRYIREGFRPFSVDSQGAPLVPVSSFNPKAGEIMFRAGDQ